MIIAKLSLRLSLNNPSNALQHIMTLFKYCSKEICRKNDKQRDRERERKKSKQEREREGEQASWKPNDMVTAGNWAPQVEFPSSVLPILWMCTTNSICLVYAKFNGLSCMVPGYRFWGGTLSLYSVLCTSLTKKNPAILKCSSIILTVTHI